MAKTKKAPTKAGLEKHIDNKAKVGGKLDDQIAVLQGLINAGQYITADQLLPVVESLTEIKTLI